MIDLVNTYFSILDKIGIKIRKVQTLIIVSIVTVLFEILAIAIFIPITEMFSNEFSSIKFLGSTILIENFSKKEILISTILLILSVYLVKSVVTILNNYLVSNVWYLIDLKLKLKIFNNILTKKYSDFIKNSNSTYLNLIVIEIEKFAELIKAFVLSIVELFVMALIFILLINYNFSASIATILFLSLIVVFIYLIFKKKIVKWGYERQYYQDEYQNNIKSGLTSFLSIKINGGLSFFSKKVFKSLSKRNDFIAKQYVYENIPKSILELSGLIIIICTALFLHYFLNKSLNEIISFIILLSISFYRILPSFNRLLTGYNQIIFSEAIINIIKDYLKVDQNCIEKRMSSIDKIHLNKVNFGYENKSKIIKDLSLVIGRGDIIGVFGKSGSGKSTLIKIIMGLIKNYDGKICYDQIDIKELNDYITPNLFGYLEQNVNTFNSTIKENITLVENLDSSKESWYREILKICNLSSLENKIKNKIIIESGLNISGGEVQRIGLARVLFQKPEIIVLDEFTSALDKKNKELLQITLRKINKKYKTTIILISHDLSFKNFCDRVITL